jgi:hypothetical protein
MLVLIDWALLRIEGLKRLPSFSSPALVPHRSPSALVTHLLALLIPRLKLSCILKLYPYIVTDSPFRHIPVIGS